MKIRIYRTDVDGWITESNLYWQFIASCDLKEEFYLWKSAIVKDVQEAIEGGGSQ